jgi:cytochrome P450
MFILAMILFPEVQEKARAQLDSVVGMDRLPAFDDRTSLPYIEAVVLETLRWNPAIPIG